MNKDYLKILPEVNSCVQHGVNSIFSCRGDFALPMQERICFGSFTKYFTDTRTVDITVRMYRKPFIQRSINGDFSTSYGVTPFTNEEIVQYLNDLRKIFPFEFEVNEHTVSGFHRPGRVFANRKDNEREAIDVTYHISGPHIVFMFVLSLQRFLYAQSDNYPLAIAFEIKNGDYGFSKMNLFNILNCVISTISNGDRGGDMFHFNPSRFMYLYNSKELREMLLKREEEAVKKENCCVDLYYSMLYVNDPDLKKMTVGGWNRFPGFADSSVNMDELIKTITNNLTVLRRYNGFTTNGEEKRRRIRENIHVDEDDVNYYSPYDDYAFIPKTKVDESLLTD